MDEFIDFILTYWQTILIVFLSFVFFILQILFKKHPVELYDSTKSLISKLAPGVIKRVESSGVEGSSEKLSNAISLLYTLTAVSLSYEEWCGLYKDYAIKVIEDVLSTPQKKG